MSRTQPGAVILDQLRDRIVSGLYFGNWQPGERLPSIRDIADAESVDRKTAAAAYHRLEEEGLVEVKARSGVFLRDERLRAAGRGSPLEKLQRRWLKNTWDGARALGLDTDGVLHLMQAVRDVEAMPIPIVEEDDATGRTIAAELREHAGIDARPIRLQDTTRSGMFAAAPFCVTTPYYAARVAAAAGGRPLITATLSLDLLYGLLQRAADQTVLVAVPSDWIANRVEIALRQRVRDMSRIRVTVVTPDRDLGELRGEAACVFVWPGCDHLLSEFPGDDCVAPVRLVSEPTIDRVRTAVLDAALRRIAALTRSSVVAARAEAAAPAG